MSLHVKFAGYLFEFAILALDEQNDLNCGGGRSQVQSHTGLSSIY